MAPQGPLPLSLERDKEEATMSLYPLALFVHVSGAIGTCVSLGIWLFGRSTFAGPGWSSKCVPWPG